MPAPPFKSLVLITAVLAASDSLAAPQEAFIQQQIDKICDPESLRSFSTTRTLDLKSAITKFTQVIYLDLLKKNEGPNFVFSPLSIHSALSLLFLGASLNSETQRELQKAIGTFNNPCVLSLLYKNVIDSYEAQESFLYGNKIWLKEEFMINEEYQREVKRDFNAEIERVSFTDPKTLEIVNGWVKDLTRGKIEELVKAFSPETKAFLANALYFKEKWKYPFTDKDILGNDLRGDFLVGKKKVDIGMMQLTSEELVYGEISHNGAQAEVVSIPYQNEDFEMQIIVPTKNSHLAILEQDLQIQEEKDLHNATSEDYFNIFSAAKNSTDLEIIDVRITMPPFQTASKFDVSSALESLGAERVFSESAELGRLSPSAESVALSRVLHRAAIEVTLEGTEGAAATGVELALFSADFGVNKNVLVDRPFIFVIQDRRNDIPVLVGRVGDPALHPDP